MNKPNPNLVTEQSSEMTTRYELEPNVVVVPDKGWNTREAGQRWSLRYAIEEIKVEPGPNGGIVTVGEPELHVFAVKLTKRGTPLTGHPHLLYWLHSWEELNNAVTDVLVDEVLKAHGGHDHSVTTCRHDAEGPSIWWLCGYEPTYTPKP